MNVKVNGFSGIARTPFPTSVKKSRISGATFRPDFKGLEKVLTSVVLEKRAYTVGGFNPSLEKRIGFVAGRTVEGPKAEFYRILNGLFASAPEVFSPKAGREAFHELMKRDVTHTLEKILKENQFREDFLTKTVKDLVTAYKYPSASVNPVLNECRRIIRGA